MLRRFENEIVVLSLRKARTTLNKKLDVIIAIADKLAKKILNEFTHKTVLIIACTLTFQTVIFNSS